jgi:cyanate lyase
MIRSIARIIVVAFCFLSSAYAYADNTLQFSAPSYNVNEDGTAVSITVTRSDEIISNLLEPVEVDYSATDGTATDGSDYVSASGTLTFDPLEVSQTFTIEILDDEVYEGDETVNLTLSDPSDNATLGDQATAVLIIAEDDEVPPAGSLQFSAPTYKVDENGSAASITVTRVNGSFGIVAVDYNTGDGTASAGSDYTAARGTLIFDDGVTSQTFTIDFLDDTEYEGDETVNLRLRNPAGGAGLGSPATAVLTIAEDDPIPPVGSLQFSAPAYTFAENGVTASISVSRVDGSFGTVGVDYASSDGTATAGSDYTAASGSLSFADGVTSQIFTIDILNDADYEGDETVKLRLRNPTGGAGLGSPASAVVTIAEDDPTPPVGSLQFSAPTYTVAENGVTARVTVTRVGGSFGTVGVDYASSDGTAIAGSDYTAVIGSLSFADGVTSRTFTIDINNDADYEGDETVNLRLRNPSGGAGLGSPATAVLTITEDDPVPPAGSLQFSAPAYTFAENGVTASISVSRVDGSFGTVGVDYASSDGTATAGSDYTAVNGRLRFADGVTSQTFTIDIIDDADYEGNETVNLALSNPSGDAGLASPASAVLTIAEDEPVPPAGSLQFSAPTYTVAENGLTASITVTRVGGSLGTVGVDYASSDGTAFAGSDYTAVIGSLSFADGVTSQAFTIDLLDDADYEGDETVNLSLSNPSGGAGLGSPASVVLTIAEDEPVPPAGSLQFSAPTYTVTEFGAIATITVERIGGSVGTIGVDYATSDGTATAGDDYIAVNGSLSFADGVTSRTFSVEIINDNSIQEGNEALNLILSNPTGGAGLGSPSTAALTISEKDEIFDGSGGGSIDLITLLSLLSFSLRRFRKKVTF